MTRALLATEGPSEEIIGARIVTHLRPGITIVPKAFTARGFSVVQRSATTLARAAHFGFYELLVIQFDIDDTLAREKTEAVSASSRWKEIMKTVSEMLQSLDPVPGRAGPVQVALMAPCQSTDAWITWGMMGGNGSKCEEACRHQLKAKLYGNPPTDVIEKAKVYADLLVRRMQNSDDWPPSLRFFVEQVLSGQK